MFTFYIVGFLALNEMLIVKKWANPGLFFVYFRSFLITISIQIEKSIDGVLGIRTRGRRMVGADETMELWRPLAHCYSLIFLHKFPLGIISRSQCHKQILE